MIDSYAAERAESAIVAALVRGGEPRDAAQAAAREIVSAATGGAGVALGRFPEGTARVVIRTYADALAEHARVLVGMARGWEARADADAKARALLEDAVAIESALPIWMRHLGRRPAA